LNDRKSLETYVHQYIFPKVSKKQRDYLTRFFTEYVNSGWEDSGGSDVTDGGKWSTSSTSTGETVTVSTEQKHHGSYALKCTSNGGGGTEYARVSKSSLNLGSFYARAYVYITAQGCDASGDYIRFFSAYAGANELASLGWYNNAGTLSWWLRNRSGTSYISTYSTAETRNLNEWYCIELYWQNAASANVRGYINGTLRLERTAQDTDNYGNADLIHFGLPYCNGTAANTMYGDCVIIADVGPIGPETATYTKTFTFDGQLQKSLTKTFSLDGLLQKSLTKTFTLDGQIQKTLTKTLSLDALLQSGVTSYTKTFTLDGLLTLQGINTFTFDSVLSKAGQSTDSAATAFTLQRKCFYANGRFWNFYSDGTHMVYRTSTDNITWTAEKPIRLCNYGFDFSIWFDGTYMHYAYADEGHIFYRRGTPNSNGTVTWSTAEVEIPSVGDLCEVCSVPFVSVDSNSYPYIAYSETISGDHYPFVTKGDANDGTFGDHAYSFPYQLTAISASTWRASVIPLTSQKMFAFWGSEDHDAGAKIWDGDSWEIRSFDSTIAPDHSSVAIGDDIWIAEITYVGSVEVLYFPDTVYDGFIELEIGENGTSAPTIIKTNTGLLYVFWSQNDTVVYKKSVDGENWDANPTVWIDETSDSGLNHLTSFYELTNSYIGLLYMTKADAPHNIKFAYFTPTLTYTKTFTFDAHLTKALTKTLTFDALLQKTLTKTLSFDAILEAGLLAGGDSRHYYYGVAKKRPKGKEILQLLHQFLTVILEDT
jgi:hypothetical protein